jgi:hypothetical protein
MATYGPLIVSLLGLGTRDSWNEQRLCAVLSRRISRRMGTCCIPE